MTENAKTGPYIGRPMPRFEDKRLISGNGQYTDDFHFSGLLYAAFVRSPYVHANILSIDTEGAKTAPGVVAVFTGADYEAGGGGRIPHVPVPADAVVSAEKAFGKPGNGYVIDERPLPMPTDKVVHLGEPVAVVIAETQAQATDAAEAVFVDYDGLDAVADIEAAMASGAPVLARTRDDNIAITAQFGDEAATKAALAAADVVIEHKFVNQRIVNAQMEPRSCIGQYDPSTETYTMIAGSQGAIRQRDTLAVAFDVPKEKMHVICPDVGGGFGPRSNVNHEQPVVLWAAKQLGRPVKWTSTRSEAFLADFQGRDSIAKTKMGFTKDGRITGYSMELLGNVGAYTVSYVPLSNGYRIMTTVYDVPAAFVDIKGVMTNTAPTAPYRGAGRPEAHFAIERLLDMAAVKLGIDRAEIRKRNLIPHEKLPYQNAMGLNYDSGAFASNFARALQEADYEGFPARRTAAEARGKLAGIGIANYVESPVGTPHERFDVFIQPEGVVRVVAGTQSTGQGHETSFAQVLADRLGITPEQVKLVTGDTKFVVTGGGTHSDRSMRLGGALMIEASGEIIEKAKAVVALATGVVAADVTFEDGHFRAQGTNEAFSIFDVARMAEEDKSLPTEMAGPLGATATFTGRMPAFPTGAAVCEVEIDAETCVVDIVRYTSIDDVGQPINPMILHGQVHGGIVQGVGQALIEGAFVDPDTQQVLTGSFMDYGMPRADMFPTFDVAMVEDPTEGNELRVKGGGESGITPSLATTMNAVVDALSKYGVRHVEMPATPTRIWQAIEDAKAGKTQ